MADSKFSYVRALVQGGSLTNLATASPWTVSHFGGTGLTLTAASRIRAESGSIGRAATLCAEAVASLDMALVGSTVLAAGRATLVVGASGNQLACELDGIQVGSLYLPLSSQRALFAIEYGPDGANENYFFRATGESSGGTVTTTASVPLTASAGSAGNLVVAGGPLIGTAPATPSHGTVNVATTRPGVLANAVPHIVSFSQANAAAGFTDRQAASTGGSLSITASRAGSADVTYTITNTAGLTLAGMCSVLVVGIAGLIGGSTSFLSGASRVTTATAATGANWLFLLSTPGLSFPAEPGTPIAATTVTGTGLVVPQVVQGGVYGAIGASVTQRDVISLSLPAANASMSLSVALRPALNATASMANIATGLDSLVAQIGAVGFTASWQQIGTDQYVINTERQTPGGFTLSASLSIDTSWIPNPITTLHAMRVTTAARYTAVGGVPDAFPSLPWPTTSIPTGGGSGPISSSEVYLKFEDGAGSGSAGNSGVSGGPFSVSPHAIVSSQHKDGAGSLQLTGASYDVMNFGSVTGPGTGDYTAEMWVKFPSLPGSPGLFVSPYARGFAVSSGGAISLFTDNGSTSLDTTAGAVSANVWYHIAAVRASGTVKFYFNGVSQELGATGQTGSVGAPLSLGEDGSYGSGVAAFIDEYRFTNAAVYTADFTPSSPLEYPVPSGDTSLAGYNDLDAITGTGTFNTQLTAPDAYFFSSATLDDSVSTGDAYTVDGNSINFTGPRTLANTTCTGTFVYGTPQNFSGTVTLDENTAASTFYSDTPKEWTGTSTLDDATSVGLMLLLAPATFSGDTTADDVTGTASSFSTIEPIVWRVNATVPVATLVSRATRTYVDAMVPAAQLSASIQFMRVAAVVPVAELNARIQYIRVDATVPAATLVARAWPTVVNATVPVAELAASITPYVGAALDATVPAATLSAWGGTGLVATVPMATLSASATVVNTLRLDAGLPRTTLAGFMTTGGAFRLDANVAVPTLSSWTGAQLDGTVPVATGFASAMFGGSFLLNASVPMATAEIGASSINLLSLSGTVPVASRDNWLAVAGTVPAAGVFASMSQVVATTTVAYNFTMANAAMTRYPAYPFTQVIRMGSTYYGVAPDGLYELGGETDNGVAIPWSFETCMDDFKEPKKKTVASVFIGGKVPANMTVTTKTGDLPSGTDAHTTKATAVLRNHRQKLGLGRRSRFFAFGLSAPQGATQIEDVTFEVATTTRRM